MATKLNKKVLVVEDEHALRVAVADMFAYEGFDVLQAKNGEEGITVALAEHPDIILLDLMMPHLENGIVMFRKLREDKPWGSSVPVLFLTNYAEKEQLPEDIHDEKTEYFVKSDWNIADVVKKVRERLKNG